MTLLAALALAAVACSPSDTTGQSGTSDEAVTAVDEAPDPIRLSYELVAGTSYNYEVGLDQSIELTAEGNASAAGSEHDIPGAVSINVSGTATLTHEILEGPEEGTFEIHITGDFGDLAVTGTVDGEDVAGEIPDFAELGPIDVTVVVDEMGNVVDGEGSIGEDFFGGDLGRLGDFGGLGDFGSAADDLGRFFGPALTEEEVTVGDTWSETIETPGVFGGDPIVTQVDSEVIAAEPLDGHDVLVIATTTTTDSISFDLGEILIGFMLTVAPEGISDEEQAEIDAVAESIKFLFQIDETVASNTTWFDFEAGIARQAEHHSDVRIVMDINAPDDETGELEQFEMDMTIDQAITFRLIDGESA